MQLIDVIKERLKTIGEVDYLDNKRIGFGLDDYDIYVYIEFTPEGLSVSSTAYGNFSGKILITWDELNLLGKEMKSL